MIFFGHFQVIRYNGVTLYKTNAAAGYEGFFASCYHVQDLRGHSMKRCSVCVWTKTSYKRKGNFFCTLDCETRQQKKWFPFFPHVSFFIIILGPGEATGRQAKNNPDGDRGHRGFRHLLDAASSGHAFEEIQPLRHQPKRRPRHSADNHALFGLLQLVLEPDSLRVFRPQFPPGVHSRGGQRLRTRQESGQRGAAGHVSGPNAKVQQCQQWWRRPCISSEFRHEQSKQGM